MNAPKTLAEAREQLEASYGRLAELSDKLAAYENSESLAAAGIVRVDDEKGVHFSVPRIPELEAKVSESRDKVVALESENKTLVETVRLLKIELSTAVDLAEAEKASYEARITKLESSQKTIESRAREMLASQGGPPLAVDGTDAAELTTDILRSQLQATKDPNIQIGIYRKLKAQEAIEKSRINGKR